MIDHLAYPLEPWCLRERWDLAQLRDRARDSITHTDAGTDDAAALDRLLALMAYVDGDYGDTTMFDTLGRGLGGARRPIEGLAGSGLSMAVRAR